jgi:hypothetical protein
MVADEVWDAVGAPDGSLCVDCVEERLDRALEPDDFPPLPLNDDEETDSVRLRTRKGSGRRTEPLYTLATAAVMDLGTDVDVAAERLGLSAELLAIWVENTKFNREVLAEIAAEELPKRRCIGDG